MFDPLVVQSYTYNINWQHVDPHVTIWLFNIAMENGPFIDGSPIINGDFPWLC